MSGLVFLVVAVLLSVAGSVAVWLRNRTPSSVRHGIDQFSREMQALAPEADRDPGRASRRRTGPR